METYIRLITGGARNEAFFYIYITFTPKRINNVSQTIDHSNQKEALIEEEMCRSIDH